MLIEVKRIFEKNGIPFFLACGSALGAVRHGGFIPWDDDVDLYFFGYDYDRVKDAFAKEKTNLSFHDYSTKKSYPYWFPKIVASNTRLIESELDANDYSCGVYIDLFPLFPSSDLFVLRRVKELIRYYRYAVIRAYYVDSFSKWFQRIAKKGVRRFVNIDKMQDLLKKTYEIDVNRSVHNYIDSGVFNKKAVIKAEYFKKTIYMTFEGYEMPLPWRYHEYLSDYYGDYLKLPPIEQRITGHHIIELDIPGVNELNEEV